MADGSTQSGFHWGDCRQGTTLAPDEWIVDFFAGGGGASEALRQALGRDPDVAVNHDFEAISMHAINHPFTQHRKADVWAVDVAREVGHHRVGWFHASPDCTHFSQAKAGQPRSRATRSLSWVVTKVAGTLAKRGQAPRIISLENVRQILKWGPLVAKRDKHTGRVLKLDGTVAARGERVPLDQQFLVPDKRRAGQTWIKFVRSLERLGYVVEWRCLVACDYGAGTSRTRLFMLARRDGQPIVWPTPTHGPTGRSPYVTAADCLDWSIPCPSIFDRKRPLADATCKRIAKGIKRYVLDTAEPFIIQCANSSSNGIAPGSTPLGVITAKPNGGSHAVVAPILVQAAYGEGRGKTKRRGTGSADVMRPVGTITASGSGSQALMSVFMEQANGGGPHGNPARARGACEPVSAITATGSQQRLITAHLARLRGTSNVADVSNPLRVVSAHGTHHAVVRYALSPEAEDKALRTAAFLMRYYKEGGQWGELDQPLATVTTRDRLALVTVVYRGIPYVIVDIGLRMLQPRELYIAQGFPESYVIDRTSDGRRLTKKAQVRMVGNSVSPPPLAALAIANACAHPSMEAA